MYRFIPILGMALLWLDSPAFAKNKPKPPAISVCWGKICINNLRWGRPNDFDSFDPYIEGILVNGSNALLKTPGLNFTLMAGGFVLGSAVTIESPDVPPGGRWMFRASFPRIINGRYPVKTETLVLATRIVRGGEERWIEQTLRFDPVFNPQVPGEIKKWEKIHGKRQR